jgi:hypothetical protein
MAFLAVRTPAIGFTAAGMNLGEGTSNQRLNLKELIQQVLSSLTQPQKLLF